MGLANDRRARIPGAVYLFTVAPRDRWQRRFWEHVIPDDGDFARPVDSIDYNPV